MDQRGRTIMGVSFVLGLTIGIVVGAITGNMGIWLSLGVALGLIAGAVISQTSKKGEDVEDSSEPDSEASEE